MLQLTFWKNIDELSTKVLIGNVNTTSHYDAFTYTLFAMDTQQWAPVALLLA